MLTLSVIVMLEHIYFLVLEMFLWTTRGPQVLGFTQEFAEMTKVLAANQGLYNGFLAAGIFWALFIKNSMWQLNVLRFFLFCVVIAGVYGGLSSNIKILYIQAVPAALALSLVFAQFYRKS